MSKARTKSAALAASAALTSPPPARQLTCFVVTGFGNKTDYSTGRVLNLDKTFEQLVRPACDKVNINCFRAIDANLSGSIDSIMYRWIYHADIVIADLSTLNANVFYELGVRHAQKPNTTVIIAESVLIQRIPFDLSSFVVHKYDHGGDSISAPEQERFVAHLSAVLAKLIAIEQRRLQTTPQVQAESDSPVFKHLTGMTPPSYTAQSYVEPPAYLPPGQRLQAGTAAGVSLASIIEAAEAAKQTKRFGEAIRLFKQAISQQVQGKPNSKPDLFLSQRLALVTYKNGEQKNAQGEVDKPVAMAALLEAEEILAANCEPKISTDPETLGLSGAINKRLFELSGDPAYLNRAIHDYERGFYVKQDYYNGINVAYMYNQRALLQDSRFDAIVSFGHANQIRRLVANICEQLIADEAGFARRGDQEWVVMSLAEAYQGLGQTGDGARLEAKIDRLASDFGKQTYGEQKAKLQHLIDQFQQKVRPEELNQTPENDRSHGTIHGTIHGPIHAPISLPSATDLPVASAPDCTAGVPTTPPAPTAGRRAITIDADLAPGKQIRSIELTCKIDYL